ncbi:FecR domain-containing protein [Rhizobium puerariae]|uniref:FecR domain-containing protein n=1 Tax=Rhizobium puerariae TaxID=1585791 RepID=A0ABV6AE33_9HYPH
MTSDHLEDEARALKQEAFDWLIRLNEAVETPGLRKEFETWLYQSAEHGRTWEKACRMWSSMGTATAFYERSNVPAQRRSRGRFLRPRRVFAAAAGIAMVFCLAYVTLPSLLLRYEADYQTDVAETQNIVLEDGSTVTLGPASAIASDFSFGSRSVRLLEGEAFFDVVHDASRPFHVVSRDLDVEVLGTAFDVRVSEEGTDIGLERGSVQASGSVAGKEINERLSPGDLVTVNRNDGTLTREKLSLADIGAWRNGRLIVVDATIGSTIEQIRRYHPSWIAVPDTGLAERKVSGVFNLADPDKALVALVAPHGGHVRKLSGLARIVTGF